MRRDASSSKLTIRKKRLRRLDGAELRRAQGGTLFDDGDATQPVCDSYMSDVHNYNIASLLAGQGGRNHNQGIQR